MILYTQLNIISRVCRKNELDIIQKLEKRLADAVVITASPSCNKKYREGAWEDD